MYSTTPSCTERMTIASDELEARVRQVVEAGDVRRVAIQTERRHTLIEIPGLLGCASDTMEPVWRALNALGQRGVSWTVVIEREPGWPTGNDRARRAVPSAA